MSNIGVVVEERPAHIGSFLVGRLLPFREKRSVGPFVFIDHMGPAVIGRGQSLDVPPHPHIGLSTLTFLFEGSIMHRDSLGTEMEITPGAVNWMTAGRGVVHSERTPDALREAESVLHGLQIWVALPKELEQAGPAFVHVEASAIPAWEEQGAAFRLIAGKLDAMESPVPVYSPLYMLEIKADRDTEVAIGDRLFGESGMYILEGEVRAEGQTFGPRQILIAKDSKLCAFSITAGTTVYIFGGETFPEPRHIYWNFVASDKELIEQAKKDWQEGRFPRVPGETEFVPLPGT